MTMSYRFDHIALLVRDLDESVAFLTAVLGLTEIANPMGGTAIRWIEIGDGRRFHVQAGDVTRVHVEKQTHFALSASDFDAVLARLRRDGVAFSDMPAIPAPSTPGPTACAPSSCATPTATGSRSTAARRTARSRIARPGRNQDFEPSVALPPRAAKLAAPGPAALPAGIKKARGGARARF